MTSFVLMSVICLNWTRRIKSGKRAWAPASSRYVMTAQWHLGQSTPRTGGSPDGTNMAQDRPLPSRKTAVERCHQWLPEEAARRLQPAAGLRWRNLLSHTRGAAKFLSAGSECSGCSVDSSAYGLNVGSICESGTVGSAAAPPAPARQRRSSCRNVLSCNCALQRTMRPALAALDSSAAKATRQPRSQDRKWLNVALLTLPGAWDLACHLVRRPAPTRTGLSPVPPTLFGPCHLWTQNRPSSATSNLRC